MRAGLIYSQSLNKNTAGGLPAQKIKGGEALARKIAIASGKGGVGKTTAAIGIGKALAEIGKNVLLIDCDSLRSVDLILGAGETIVYDWGDVMLGRCRLFDAVYRVGNISIMTSPQSYRQVTVKKMSIMLKMLDNSFDYIILDAPAGIEMGFILACVGADRGIVVSTPDLVCVRSAYKAAEEMLKYSVSDVRLIVNRVVKKDIRRGRLLCADDVIDKTEVRLLGVVPEDRKIRYSAMGRDVFVLEGPSNRAFRNIAARIDGRDVPIKL